mmetsp:Transcript_70157/g.227592  ORF Transcript_70157/g.227592 Transcript_70157/m.227592 type:complete len:128 (-) Transcript_70157:26-409(-)
MARGWRVFWKAAPQLRNRSLSWELRARSWVVKVAPALSWAVATWTWSCGACDVFTAMVHRKPEAPRRFDCRVESTYLVTRARRRTRGSGPPLSCAVVHGALLERLAPLVFEEPFKCGGPPYALADFK